MQIIFTTVFYFQCRNQEAFLICALIHYPTKVKFHLDLKLIYYTFLKDFNLLLTIHASSKN